MWGGVTAQYTSLCKGGVFSEVMHKIKCNWTKQELSKLQILLISFIVNIVYSVADKF